MSIEGLKENKHFAISRKVQKPINQWKGKTKNNIKGIKQENVRIGLAKLLLVIISKYGNTITSNGVSQGKC